ncbi:MAG TPA: hypothetical protein VHS31_03100, partial [Tepidisphaeraceae bacterium]|nr:hypothetical protein [Tepidisphaeraceae bacterium]
MTFDPQGKILASGGGDKTVKVWETRSGRLLHTLEGHQHAVLSVAFDPQGEILASGGGDKTIKFWEVRNGKLLRTLEGHQEKVYSVTFDPRGMMLASGSVDKTVKLWEAPSGKLLRTLEGHTASIDIVAFSPDGRLLASKGRDQTIRLWSCETWQTVAIIPEPATPALWIPALAFHPTRSLLATAGSELGKPLSERSGAIHIWELDFDVLSSQRATPTVTYSSVKVVLVGESNVGKSYLAHRIATGASPAQGVIKSTHGMKFWPLEPAPSGSMPTTLIGERVQTSLFTEKLFGTSVVEVNKSQRRDIVLWDMGGQEEYRLIHQLFLHDTTVALVLLDPTRGTTAFKEVETWNKSLERQLRGRTAVKLLVGAKMDQPSGTVDYKALERLREECGFAAYLETSAVTGRGVDELCDAVAAAIDWNNLGKTSRPELFQAIRDELERRRKNGVVVVLLDDFNHELSTDEKAETFSLIEQEVSLASDADAGKRALYAVCEQLAQQGVIALSRTSSGKRAVILRIEEVERYAGSLVLAARNNPREVPALEFRAIASEGFSWPGIDVKERLSREQEKAVIECTVQLMLEHGICFQHEGLMVFPSLFAPTPETADVKLAHAISLYYDFAGAIDNIYASLVAWLVLAKEFGKVRLWSDRAEFEIKDGGLCGLRKVGRAGGFAHVDVYFEKDTPDRQREEFISFVEDHLRQNGVEIREHVAITCPCGHEFTEGTLRQRIARGEKDVGCPVCETRHSMTDGAAAARERDAKIEQHTWALRTQIEKRREELTEQATQTLAKSEKAEPQTGPIRLLHLSDLHFTKDTPVDARLQWLLDDLKLDGGLGIKELDYLAITGDFTDKGGAEGFEKA